MVCGSEPAEACGAHVVAALEDVEEYARDALELATIVLHVGGIPADVSPKH